MKPEAIIWAKYSNSRPLLLNASYILYASPCAVASLTGLCLRRRFNLSLISFRLPLILYPYNILITKQHYTLLCFVTNGNTADELVGGSGLYLYYDIVSGSYPLGIAQLPLWQMRQGCIKQDIVSKLRCDILDMTDSLSMPRIFGSLFWFPCAAIYKWSIFVIQYVHPCIPMGCVISPPTAPS